MSKAVSDHTPLARATLTRRGALGASLAATIAGVPVAVAATPDAALLDLLASARAELETWQASPAEFWKRSDPLGLWPWQASLRAAALLPATTRRGMEAKADAARWWLLCGCDTVDHLTSPEAALAVSSIGDLLRLHGEMV